MRLVVPVVVSCSVIASGDDERANRRRRRPVHPVTLDAILDATAVMYGTSPMHARSDRAAPSARVLLSST